MYIGTLYAGILGASVGILIVGFIQIILGYSMFIKPVTGYGFLYYLWKPLIIMLFVCSTTLLLNWLNSGFLFKIILFMFSR